MHFFHFKALCVYLKVNWDGCMKMNQNRICKIHISALKIGNDTVFFVIFYFIFYLKNLLFIFSFSLCFSFFKKPFVSIYVLHIFVSSSIRRPNNMKRCFSIRRWYVKINFKNNSIDIYSYLLYKIPTYILKILIWLRKNSS